MFLNLYDISQPRPISPPTSSTSPTPLSPLTSDAPATARGPESMRTLLQDSAHVDRLAQGLSRVMEARPLADQVSALESLAPEEDREAYELLGSSDGALRLRRVLRTQKLIQTDPRHVEILRKDSEALMAHPAETREAALRGAERLADNLDPSDERKLEARIDARTHLLSFVARLSPDDARAVALLAMQDVEVSARARYAANPLVAEAIRTQAQALVLATGADARTQKETTLRVIEASNDPTRRRAYLEKLMLLHPTEAAELRAELHQKNTEGF